MKSKKMFGSCFDHAQQPSPNMRLRLAALIVGAALTFGFVSCKTETEDDTVYRTVTYSTEHAAAPKKLTVADGTALTEEQLPALTETGYTFGGWYDGETKAEAGYKVTKDVTLTALWTADTVTPAPDDGGNEGGDTSAVTTYTITASTSEHGTISASKTTAKEGETITLSAAPADGYKLGSYTVKKGEEAVTVTNGTFTMPAADVTVSATFEALPPDTANYTVRHLFQKTDASGYEQNANSPDETKSGTIGADTQAEAKTVMGFTTQSFTQVKIATSDTTVEIKYDRNTYTVTFNANGGSEVTSQTVLYGSTANKPIDPTKEATANTELYARWTETAITYTVTIVSNIENGSVSADKVSATAGESITLTTTPEDGYKLATLTVKSGNEPVTATDGTFTMPAGECYCFRNIRANHLRNHLQP